MPRNGSGTYSLPAGNPVVTGTIISSTTHNNTMSDIASEMTNSVDKDGQTVLTGIIDHNGNNIILDTDGDTLLDLGTDDQVGITIAGAADFLFLANIFRALSGSVLETNTINETTAASGVTIDGVLLKDNTVLAGTLLLGAGSVTDSSGAITFGNENLSTTGTAATGALTVTGDLTATSGNLVIGTSGKGIDFDAAAGGTSQLLDWYEEGTFTPIITFGGAHVGAVYNLQTGYYTRVGDLVTAMIEVGTSTKSSSTGTAEISGLPFAATGVSVGVLYPSSVTFADVLINQVQTSTVKTLPVEITNGGSSTVLTDANFFAFSALRSTVNYKA